MPANSTTSTERPKEAANRLYSDRFLTELGKRFGFDALEPEAALELRRIARFYLFAKREESRPYDLSMDQREYRASSNATRKFIEVLKAAQEDDIATDMFLTAKTITRSNNQIGVSDLPENLIESRNDRHYRHLLGLLNLLAAAAKRKFDYFKLPSGPRKNVALESITQSASEYWSDNLGRKFTIDYHKGSGLTEAFLFVRALVDPLDKVSDQQIITAMRTEIKSANAREKRQIKPRVFKPRAK